MNNTHEFLNINTGKIKITVKYDRDGQPTVAHAEAAFTAQADAEALFNTLPKRLGFTMSLARFYGDYDERGFMISAGEDVWLIKSSSKLRSIKGNEKNETGIKRLVGITKLSDVVYDAQAIEALTR